MLPDDQRRRVEKLLYFAANVGTGTKDEADTAFRLAQEICAKYDDNISNFQAASFKENVLKKAADYSKNPPRFGTFMGTLELFGFEFDYYNNGRFIFKNQNENTWFEVDGEQKWHHYNQFGQELQSSKMHGDLMWHLKTRPDRTLMPQHSISTGRPPKVNSFNQF